MKSFKDELTFGERLKESTDMMTKFPGRVPLIAERYARTDLPELEKKNWLTGLGSERYARGTTASLIGSLYASFKDEDGFLH
ncbi:Autophagy-related protein [Drosera capensis]